GVSVKAFDLKDKMYPMIYAGDAPNTKEGFDGSQSRNALVTGKIVLCDLLTSGNPSLSAGAVGTVMQDGGFKDVAFSFPLPATYLGLDDDSNVTLYLNKTKNPVASILKSIDGKDGLAPFVVSFSSRGPNPITSDILE
ncbi:hypothetical protein MKW94_017962, partial [Papaver nudicaule]|nr:hypothetical protein [Papaver nudicaule]